MLNFLGEILFVKFEYLHFKIYFHFTELFNVAYLKFFNCSVWSFLELCVVL